MSRELKVKIKNKTMFFRGYRSNSQEKTTRNKMQLAKFKESDNSNKVFEAHWKLYVLGLRPPVGARRRLAVITGSKFRMKSCTLMASSQHVGATAAVSILRVVF